MSFTMSFIKSRVTLRDMSIIAKYCYFSSPRTKRLTYNKTQRILLQKIETKLSTSL